MDFRRDRKVENQPGVYLNIRSLRISKIWHLLGQYATGQADDTFKISVAVRIPEEALTHHGKDYSIQGMLGTEGRQ